MNLGITEMIFIFVLALLIFGPRKLPEIGRQLGKGLAEFKRASNEFRNQIEEEVRQVEYEEERKKTIAAPPPAPEGTIAAGALDTKAPDVAVKGPDA
jgi:TatA/E family protein of Tat protein translocase